MTHHNYLAIVAGATAGAWAGKHISKMLPTEQAPLASHLINLGSFLMARKVPGGFGEGLATASITSEIAMVIGSQLQNGGLPPFQGDGSIRPPYGGQVPPR
jgi:hypothetical protein